MNLSHDLSHVLERVATGRQNVTSRMIWTESLLNSYPLECSFMHFRHLAGLCVSVLYGICNFPAPSFPFDKTRLKDLSASSKSDIYT
jgi:hypothetical protein